MCHSKYWLNREMFRFCYRMFVQEYRDCVQRMRPGVGVDQVRFPGFCFPPGGVFVYPEQSPSPAQDQALAPTLPLVRCLLLK